MIVYLSSHNYSQMINGVIMQLNKNVLSGFVEDKIELNDYIKKQLDQFQSIDTFIIDLTCIVDIQENMIQALNSFRLLYSNVKIIIIAPECSVNDKVLSEIFCLGIYNIVTASEIEDLEKELIYCLNVGKEYKDSVQYKLDNKEIVEKSTGNKKSTIKEKIIKEKVIIKNEIIQKVSKAQIAFVGTQERIGVTHNAIMCANFLRRNGHKVAIVESKENNNKVFHTIKQNFEFEKEELGDDYFSIKEVDYYPDYPLEELYNILYKNYNFVLIDFGVFNTSYLAELNRCIISMIVCGSKPWELAAFDKVFMSTTEDILKTFYYLFNYTDPNVFKQMKEGMPGFKHLHIADMISNPFEVGTLPYMEAIFKEYISKEHTVSTKKRKGLLGLW